MTNMKKEGRKLNSLYFYIKKFAETINEPEEETAEETPEKSKWVLHRVSISYVITKPVTVDKNKEMGQNFQWSGFLALVSDTQKENWSLYTVDLETWGAKVKGTDRIVATDFKGNPLKDTAGKSIPSKITVEQLVKWYPKIFKLSGPEDLNIKSLPEESVKYIDKIKRQELHPMSFKERVLDLKNPQNKNMPFYILIAPKSNELMNPFGDFIEKIPETETVK